MRGDRHMGTVRSHNRVHRAKGGGKTLTKAERAAKASSIHNRGEDADMNGDKQREHKNVRAELGEVAKATAEELDAIRGLVAILRAEQSKLRGLLLEERAARGKQADEQRRYVDRGDGLVADSLERFLARGWRDRLRWIFLGN